MGRAWGAFHSLQRRNGASYSDEQHADLHDLTAAFYRAAGSLTGNLVNPKVGPTWGDLQALPDWLQNHRPTESNVSSGESIEISDGCRLSTWTKRLQSPCRLIFLPRQLGGAKVQRALLPIQSRKLRHSEPAAIPFEFR